jgi:hypothetical protein
VIADVDPFARVGQRKQCCEIGGAPAASASSRMLGAFAVRGIGQGFDRSPRPVPPHLRLR